MTHDMQSLEQLQRSLASHLVSGLRAVDSERDGCLAGLDPAELLRSSRTLTRKRLSQTAAMLPITRRLLGPAFDKAFFQYANEVHFNGPKALLQDAVAFAGWLSTRLEVLELPAAICKEQVAECCRFEGGLCAWHASDWGFWRDRFSWDWRHAAPAAGGGDVPRRSICRWLWRLGTWTGGRVWG
jgi:hypothetical protein